MLLNDLFKDGSNTEIAASNATQVKSLSAIFRVVMNSAHHENA